MLWKCCTQYASKFGKLSSGHRTGKDQFSFQSQSRAMPESVQTTTQLHSFHMLAKQCSKFSAGLQEYVNRELPDVQAVFRKGEIKLPTSVGSSKKQENSRKTSTPALLTMPKPLTVWITTNCGIFFKRWEYQTALLASWEICMQVKKQQLELDMEQQIGSKLWK